MFLNEFGVTHSHIEKQLCVVESPVKKHRIKIYLQQTKLQWSEIFRFLPKNMKQS